MVLECKLYRIQKPYCQERNIPKTKLIKHAYTCDRKTHSNIFDISAVRKLFKTRSFRGVKCNTHHYLVGAEVP